MALLAAATVGLTAGLARADTKVALGGSIDPVIRFAPKRPQSVALTVSLHFSGDQDGGLPPILQRATIWFPYGAALNARLFPSCAANTINRRGAVACPAGSEVGAGTVVGVGADIVESLKVRLFNGPGGRSIVFYLRGDNPLRVDTAFDAPLTTFHTGEFEYRLLVGVPANLQNIAGVDIAVRDFKTTVRASRKVHGRTRGYIEALVCPPRALVPIRGIFDFSQSPSVTADSYLRCG